jgi:hypothetical protein
MAAFAPWYRAPHHEPQPRRELVALARHERRGTLAVGEAVGEAVGTGPDAEIALQRAEGDLRSTFVRRPEHDPVEELGEDSALGVEERVVLGAVREDPDDRVRVGRAHVRERPLEAGVSAGPERIVDRLDPGPEGLDPQEGGVRLVAG